MLPESAMYPLDYIVTCEGMHFLLASSVGLLAFFLTSIICFKAWPEKDTYLSPWGALVFFSLASHWIADVQGWGF